MDSGTGPVHGQFFTPDKGSPFFFVFSETSNTIRTFNVSYVVNGSLELTGPTYAISTFAGANVEETMRS
jgi:hypothetical protein